MTVFYLVFEIRPSRLNHTHVGGAYVHCWIRRDSDDAIADHLAARLEAEGWAVVSWSQPAPVQREELLADEDALEAFDMAMRDGEALQLHSWIFEGDD